MNIKNLRKNKKGFTLIEIIVVVVILAVLMAVAVPSVLKYMNEADDAKFLSQARGGMIVAEAEATKQYMKLETKPTANTTWTATPEDIAAITGTPKVSNVVATIDKDGTVTQVVVTFADAKKTATVTPNGSVKLADTE